MRRWVLLLATGIFWAQLIGAPMVVAQTPAAVPLKGIDTDDLGAFVDGFVQGRMKAQNVVGVTVSVVHDGRMIFARGYGHDDLEAGRRVDADRTLFRPGSISKTFTWTAVMQLYEQGKLDLDADIRTYLSNLEIADTFAEPITMKHLMAHTPGYEDSALGHLFGNDPDHVPALLDYLQHYRPARVRAPGTLPSYSNYGVAVAGQIVANVSGMPWETYVERHLLEPLGMHDSTFREPWNAADPTPMPARLRDNVSKGYLRQAGGYRPGTFTFISQVGPAGALATTATDMARWMLVHLNHGQLGDVRILAPETVQEMHRQHYTMDPRMPGLAHGFIESVIHGYRAIGHGGGTIYFISDMQLVPELGLGVFISTNTSGAGGLLVGQFVNTLVERYFPPGPGAMDDLPVGEAARPLEEYAGTYLSTRRPYTTVERLVMTTGAIIAASPDGYLVATAPGLETRLEPLGGDEFRATDTGTLFKFTADEDGEVDAMLLPIPIMVMQKVGPLANPRVLYGVLAAAAVVMICAVIGAWLRRKRELAQSTAEAWAGRLAVVTALLWLGVYAVGMVGLAPLADDLSQAFFEFPTPAFLASLGLALAAAVLTVLSALLLYPVWSTATWPLGRRIRHTGVVLAAVATLLVLRNFNAIGFNYLSG
jgi:CubicO group peptidase (beta-lactamase class C family)